MVDKKFLSDLIDAFKTKNPKVYAIVYILLLGAYLTLEYFGDKQVCDVNGCVDFLGPRIKLIAGFVKYITLGVFGLLGAHTPENSVSEQKSMDY